MADAYVGVLESSDPAAKQVDNETNVIGGATRYRQRVRVYQGDGSGDPTNPWAFRLSDGTHYIDPRDRNWTIGETVAVSAAALPLPTGASTETTLAAVNAKLGGTLTVDASGHTVPVSGTFWQATQPISLASLPALAPGSAVIGHVIVDSAPTTAVTGTFWQATQPVSLAAAVDVSDRSARLVGHVTVDNATLAVTESGTWNVNATLGAETTKVIGTVNQGTSPWVVQAAGDVASGATDSGNPAKIGAVYNQPDTNTVSNGQRVNLQADNRGHLKVVLWQRDGANEIGTVNAINDSQTTSLGVFGVIAAPMLYNGTNLDRQRSASIGDGAGATGLAAVSSYLNNGTTFDRAPGDKTNGAYVQTKAEVATAALLGSLPSVLKSVAGYDGSYVRPLRADTTGALVSSNDLVAPLADMVIEMRMVRRGIEILIGEEIDPEE